MLVVHIISMGNADKQNVNVVRKFYTYALFQCGDIVESVENMFRTQGTSYRLRQGRGQ